jgi:trehalose 6-phosphate synthase
MVQLATPSRERVEHYQKMRSDIERMVSRINGEYGRVGHPVVHYLHQSVDRKELVAFFSAADVMLVTPLRDGMNLVCKEYVACRPDLGGTLVLSEFAGAAAELTSAFLVNPHDLDGVKNAMEAALAVDPAEGRRRMRALRRQVLTHDVDRWARSFLDALGPEQPQP